MFEAMSPAYELHTVYGVFSAETLDELVNLVLTHLDIWTKQDVEAMARTQD